MRIALLFTLLLAVAPLAHGQQSTPLVEPRAQVVERQPPPQGEQVAPAKLYETRATPQQELAAAQQEGPSRTVWFLVGALTVAAILLVVLL